MSRGGSYEYLMLAAASEHEEPPGAESPHFRSHANGAALTRRNAVRPGSSLTAYFRPDLPVHGAWSEELVRETSVLIDRLGPNEELVGLVDRGARPMVEAEYLANAGELTSWAPAVMGDTIWIGKYPDWPPDGEDALTRVVPEDAGGVVRSHPY